MTKRRIFSILAFGAATAALYAFSVPNPVRERVLTVFFPEETKPVAPILSTESLSDIPFNWKKSEIKTEIDTIEPVKERYGDFLNNPNPNVVDLKDPKAVESKVEYDPLTGLYIISEKIGDEYFRAPTYMTFDEYVAYRDRKQQKDYFDRLQGVAEQGKRREAPVDPISKFNIRTSLIERLFGGTEVDIKPQGNINLTFGVDHQKVENPILPIRLQRTTNFDFDMDINMSAQGKIGEKLNLNFNYNTQATFDFDNQIKLKYDPKNFSEDEILQNIEAGNVSMPLRSTLIKGASNLFGVKAELKFGHLRTTLIASQQRSRQQGITLKGGAQVQNFIIPIDEYDENRHFFLSQWNRSEFEPAMKCLPVPLSQFNITKIQVWVTVPTNFVPGQNTPPTRQIIALADLAEPRPFLDGTDETNPANIIPDLSLTNPPARDIKGGFLPTNQNNLLYNELLSNPDLRLDNKVVNGLSNLGLVQVRDYGKVSAVQLVQGTDYTYNEQLGFISINRSLRPNDVVGVSLEYTYNGVPYKIGEFGEEISIGDTLNQNVLFLKMLKSTAPNVRYPIWDLMMKNVYAVGAVNVDPQEFRFDIFYEDPGKGQKRFLDQGFVPQGLRSRPLIQVFNLDNLNLQGDPGADGIFDFVPGLTVNVKSGRVMFPVLEPFGSFLLDKFKESDPGADSLALAKQILYTQLYDSTLFRAREFQQLNRFTLRGFYKSSNSSEISLGTFNLPRGSVRVSGGGRLLQEGVDYTIDYNIGKIRILNDGILQSGQNISVNFEDNTLFGFNARTMLGARFDYEFSKDITVGGTFMNLFERPLTQKVNFGDDPINNKVYGLDFNYTKEAPWLTKLVDKLPLFDTKAESRITAAAEVAALQPGYNKAINQGSEKGGLVYIDDFEGSTANIPLSFPANSWMIASVPQGDLSSGNDLLFPENASANSTGPDSLALNANRAKMAWYIADPSALDNQDSENPYTRLFRFQDIFPNRQLSPLEQSTLRPLDVTIFPNRRGPYNFDIPGGYTASNGLKVTEGLNSFGELAAPETRWAGFMRGMNNSNTDFEASNVEFIEFWMMNPYEEKPEGVSQEGEMIIDLGNVSEDVMRDSRQFFESALPTQTPENVVTVKTAWGRVPVLKPLVQAFDNDPAKRGLQDIGLDGLDNEGERDYFQNWLNVVEASNIDPNVKAAFRADPSGDEFVHYLDGRYGGQSNTGPGLLERYLNFNNQEGNTPTGTGNDFVTSSTNFPDAEDLDRDLSLNEIEQYYRYRIPLTKNTPGNLAGKLVMDDPGVALSQLITDTVEVSGVTWYRFKVPLDWTQRQAVNGIQDFRSIRFIRILWKGFDNVTTFRFATLEMGRNQWRRFTQVINDPVSAACPDITQPSPGVAFDVNAVSIEENSARTPFNYTIPQGIQRENSVGAFPDVLQNEQALSMTVCGLPSCEGRGIFKTLNMDLRRFERIKMFAHAEPLTPADAFGPEEVKVFIRVGSDFFSNYYEYEIPLRASDESITDNYFSEDDEYKREVWKNVFDFPLEVFTELKKQRNAAGGDLSALYITNDPNQPENRVKIIGNPNLGYVKGVMIGVQNYNLNKPQCLEVWVNELRLNGFSDKGGYAGTARVDIQMADLGNVSAAGTFTSRGWGGIDQRLLQRQLEDVLQFDISTTVALDKFLPEKWGLRLPFYAQYSNLTRRPEFDPYDLDINLKEKIDASDPADRDSIRMNALDVTTNRAYNFTNVRKERKGPARKVPLPWNIENFSLTYAFNEQDRRTPIIYSDNLKQYKGGLDYQYATGLKPLQPFKKIKLSDKYFKFLKEFNLNPIPETYGFNTNIQRIAGTTIWRPFNSGETLENNTYYNRRLTWDRNYDLGWTIAKSLRFNFDANARSIVDEPLEYNQFGERVTATERRDSILTNMRSLGRPKNYQQNASLNYTLPFKSFKMLDWINVKASYSAGYTWSAQSLKLQNLDAGVYQPFENSRNLGNVIQNNVSRQINGDLNFEGLYNKSKYLAKINKPSSPSGKKNKQDMQPGGSGRNNGGNPGSGGNGGDPGGIKPGRNNAPANDKNQPNSGDAGGMMGGAMGDKNAPQNPSKDTPPTNDPNTPNDPNNPVVPANKAPGRIGIGGVQPLQQGQNNNQNGPGANDDKDPKQGGKAGQSGGKSKNDDKKKKDRQPTMAERIAIRPLMLVRKGRFNYTENIGSVVPGFTPESKLLGMTEGFGAPGLGYVFGAQPTTQWLENAARNGWITQRVELNEQVTRNYSQTLDAGLTVEPFKDFRVELNANRQYTRNSTELFKDQVFDLNPDSVFYEHRAYRDMGSYTTSFFSMNTLFDKDIDGLFKRFVSYGPIISNRLGANVGNINPHDDQEQNPGYREGYGKIHQEVLLPAFLAAYTEADPNTVGLDVFKTRPAINWKLNYNGLSKVGKLNKIFSSVQIAHGYKNTLTVNQYNTDIFYDAANPFQKDQVNLNYIARFEIPQVVITEQFQPLLGLDVKMKNGMSFKADFKKSRTLAMSFMDYTLNETQATAYAGGFGHRIKDVDIPFLTGSNKGKGKGSKNSGGKKKSNGKSKKDPATPPTPGGGNSSQAHDLNIKFDFEYRDDITIVHSLQRNEAQPSRGSTTISINPSVDYQLNRRLALRLFCDYRRTVPKTSQSFPITTLNSGITVQFKLN
jgi:cell surface protein SprA